MSCAGFPRALARVALCRSGHFRAVTAELKSTVTKVQVLWSQSTFSRGVSVAAAQWLLFCPLLHTAVGVFHLCNLSSDQFLLTKLGENNLRFIFFTTI